MAYQSIYTGAEIDRRLTDVDSKIPFPSPAYAGLFPMATAQGLVQWVPRGQPTDAQTRQAVEDYFASHAVPVPSVYALGNAIIRGGWNQLADVRNATGVDHGVTWSNDGQSITATGTATGGHAKMLLFTPSIVGHKYALIGGRTLIRIWHNGTPAVRSAEDMVIEVTGSGHFYARVSENDTVTGETITPRIHDLTEIFGAGNEPSIEQFKALFPDAYYPFDTPGFGAYLWGNSDTTGEFSGQTLTVNSTGYTKLYVIFRVNSGSSYYSASVVDKDYAWSSGDSVVIRNMYNGKFISRTISSVTDSAVKFDHAFTTATYGTGGARDNTNLIPYKIYGIR